MQDSEKHEAFGIPWYTEISFENWVGGYCAGAIGFALGVTSLNRSSESAFPKTLFCEGDLLKTGHLHWYFKHVYVDGDMGFSAGRFN